MSTKTEQSFKELNAEPCFLVKPISWTAAFAAKVEVNGIKGFVIDHHDFSLFSNLMSEADLPIEFFNHQLLDCDPDDEDSLMDFMSEWGLLFSPYRGAELSESAGWETSRRSQASIETTTSLEESLVMSLEEARSEFQRLCDAGEVADDNEGLIFNKIFHLTEPQNQGNVVSLEEAASTLRLLQEVVAIVRRTAQEGWSGADELFHVASTLNAGSCNGSTVQLAPDMFYGLDFVSGLRLAYRIGLTSAICNQIIACLADEAPWKLCACDGCGRAFKRKQADTYSPNYDSAYCCNRCMERQKKRNQRKGAKNRIQH